MACIKSLIKWAKLMENSIENTVLETAFEGIVAAELSCDTVLNLMGQS